MWGRQLIYGFFTRKRTLVLSKIGGTSSALLVPYVPTSSSRVPPLSSPFQLGFRRHRFRLHIEDGQGWEESRAVSTRLSTKAGHIGKFTRGSNVEVAPEATGGQ
jgi:hypothetical protein